MGPPETGETVGGFFIDFFSLKMASLKTLVQIGEHFAAAVGDQDIVLDPYAPFAGEINSRLDGDNHTRTEFFFLADFAKGGEFVDLQSDAVA